MTTAVNLSSLCRLFTIKNGIKHSIFGFRYVNRNGFLGFYDAIIAHGNEHREYINLKAYVDENNVISVDLPWIKDEQERISQEVRDLLKEFILAMQKEKIREKEQKNYLQYRARKSIHLHKNNIN